MEPRTEKAITHFLRSYKDIFTAREVQSLFHDFGLDADLDEVVEFLDEDDRVFPLEDQMYITRAGAFSGMYFGFEPTQQELEQGLFVPGDRCIPFVDPEMHSSSLRFLYGEKFIPLGRAVFETDCNTARNLFTFFGDEYASQYIGADPVNRELDLANNNFELPPKLMLSAISLKKIRDDTGFTKGDRLLCRVLDWDKGIIQIVPVINHNKNPFVLNGEIADREAWNKNMEDALLKCFDKMGPCQTMEQQLSYAFYDNRRTLCGSDCGSMHEFLNWSDKVDMELYGVETRLWKKGENVPVVGKWNKGAAENLSNAGEEKEQHLGLFSIPAFVMDCMIKDQCYEKKEDLPLVMKKIVPHSMHLSPEEEKFFQLQIVDRNAILRKHYNWFADFAWGPIRHKALDLYSQVGDLVYEIDGVGNQLEQFPQQELAILAQLFTHISRMLEMMAGNTDCEEDEKTALKLSLEGMEYNFEDIRTQLKAAVDKFKASQFKVV